MIQNRDESDEPLCSKDLSKSFATFFGTYTKAVNKAFSRTGTLFEGRFKRKQVSDDQYFAHLIAYIHRNPQIHGFVDDYRDWPYSSFQALCSQKLTRLARDETLEWFGGLNGFLRFHDQEYDFRVIRPLVEDDFL